APAQGQDGGGAARRCPSGAGAVTTIETRSARSAATPTPTPLGGSEPLHPAQRTTAGVDLLAAQPQSSSDAQAPSGSAGDSRGPAANDDATPRRAAPRVHGTLAEATLRTLAENLGAFERVRIETENRLRSLHQVYGVPEGSDLPEIVR